MKNLFSKIEFIIILAFLVLPPIFYQFKMLNVETPKTIETWYSLQTFVYAIFALFIYWQNRDVHLIRFQSKWTILRTLVLSGESFKTFGFLCVISVIFELIGNFCKIESNMTKILLPSTMNGWLNFIFGTIAAAFFEEVIYRMYLPEAMGHFIVGHPKIPRILPEIIALLLFSFGHIYLGIFGFLNAFLCGIVLRRCILKTHAIWFSFIPHAIYNFLVFLAMAKITKT